MDSGINDLQIARFATDERLTIIDSKRYSGCILGLTEKAVLYITSAMDWRAEFDGSVRRKEIPEVPIEAIREAVINAFAHRQIESRQALDVSIYKSFIDIFSPDVFPQNLEPDEFIHNFIKPPRRNPLITKTLYYSRDMEAFATGIKRIDSECKTAGVSYEFIKEPYGFTVRFRRHCGEGWEQVLSEKGTVKGTVKTDLTKSEEIAERVERVYNMIKENPRTSQESLASQFEISIKMVKKATEILQKDGKIRREGADKTGKWIVEEDDETPKKLAENGVFLSCDEASDGVSDEAGIIEEVLQYCTVPRSKAEIQNHISVVSERYFRQKILTPLLNAGRIRRTIPEKPSSPNQKYVSS